MCIGTPVYLYCGQFSVLVPLYVFITLLLSGPFTLGVQNHCYGQQCPAALIKNRYACKICQGNSCFILCPLIWIYFYDHHYDLIQHVPNMSSISLVFNYVYYPLPTLIMRAHLLQISCWFLHCIDA